MTKRAGVAEILVCTLTWASVGVIVKQITLASTVIVFFRLSLGMIVVLAWLAWRRQLGDLRPRARPVVLVASGVTLGAHWALLFEAYKRLDVAPTILIVFLGPVLMAAAAPAVLRERLRATAIVALALAFGGIALITVPDIGEVDGAGLAAALGSAVLFALLLLLGKLLTEHYRPGAIVVWQLGVAAVLMSPALVGAEAREVARGLPLLMLLGMLHTGVMGILFFRAVHALQAQQLGVLFYLEPATAVLFAWAALGEQPSVLTVLGGALVVAAGLAIIFGDRTTIAPAGAPGPVTAAQEAR